ncbi:MAG: hypothetical protein AAF696_22465 [Bacteroidota bacterium]
MKHIYLVSIRYLLGLILICSLSEVYAQNNTLSGRVLLSSDRGPKLGRLSAYDKSMKSSVNPRDIHVILYPLSFEPSWTPVPEAVITQKEERFIPQVLLITPGSTVYFLNEDNQYHNVFSRAPRATFNIGRRPPGHVYPKKINRTGLIKVFCDMHTHMRAFILSIESPYFTRLDRDGYYKLKNLPDGRYKLEVYHPLMKSFSTEIEISGGRSINRNWDLNRSR